MNPISRHLLRRSLETLRCPHSSSAKAIRCSASKLTNNFPCSHARALAGSFFGRWPNPRIDFVLLKASSICRRKRYVFRIWSGSNCCGRLVQTKKYGATRHDSCGMLTCFRLPFRAIRFRTRRVAPAVHFTAINRPLSLCPLRLANVGHPCGLPTRNTPKRRNIGKAPPSASKSGRA